MTTGRLNSSSGLKGDLEYSVRNKNMKNPIKISQWATFYGGFSNSANSNDNAYFNGNIINSQSNNHNIPAVLSNTFKQ